MNYLTFLNMIQGNQKSFKKPELMQSMYYRNYFMRFCNIAVSRFKWENLPDEIYPFAIEKFLLTSEIMFFYDEIAEMFAVLPCGGTGVFDIYGFSNERYSTCSRYVEHRSKLTSVILNDNVLQYPPILYINFYAQILAEMNLSKLMNIAGQKFPKVISGPSSMELTINNMINQIENNIPILKVKDSIMDNKINVNSLDISQPYVADKIEMQMLRVESELLTLLGVDSCVDSKRERLVSNETFSNNGEIERHRLNALSVRENFANKVNKMFNLDISVRFDSGIPITPENFMQQDTSLNNDNISMSSGEGD